METRLTSMSSSREIGGGAPFLTASTNALTHCCVPLSCRHRRILAKPFQPQPRSLRKLSSCSTLPAQNTSRRSLGKPVAVGQVMDGAHGTVGKLQRDRDPVVGNLQCVVPSV